MKKRQRYWLAFLIAVCMGFILIGGMHYVSSLRDDLTDEAVQNVLTVTTQQQQAFDNFIAGDRERLHSFAEYFAKNGYERPEEIQQQLTLFNEVDAVYSVVDLDAGWFCSNRSGSIRMLSAESLASYSGFTGSGVRDSYTNILSGDPEFGYYEAFTFENGNRGMIQKSYDRSKVSNTFSLSFYNDRGFAYIVDQNGGILLHSNGMLGNRLYNSIFDVFSGEHGSQADKDSLMAAMAARESGSKVFTGDGEEYVYTYVPMETVDDWYLVSIIKMEAITEEADKILMDSQLAMLVLAIVLAVCALFVVLIWRTRRDIKERDQEIEYQEQLFDIFATYLSSNVDDVYLMMAPWSERIEYISPNVERVLGVSREGVSTELLGFCIESCGCGEVSLERLRNMQPGDSIKDIETERVNPQTEEHKFFRVSVYCTLVQNKKKVVIYISDRTRERKTQNTLTEALNLAEVANQAKSAFLSSVSHDIRTPMNAIIGLVALLREEPDNPEIVLEYTKRIDAASQHLLGLINDVLDMNKIESGSASLNLSEMTLAGVIDEINTIIRPQAKAKNQTFDIFASPFEHEHLMGDKLRINQILINLLSNAVKYTQEGGRIEMRVEELPQVVENYSRIRFMVKDNGLGMSDEYQAVIFDPFTREETEITHQIQGTGLGMAITKSLVDLMGGSIKVESKSGEGSTFTVELELFIQELEENPKFWTSHKVSRMIVVDDEEEVCRNVVKTMAVTGVQTDFTTDGARAVQMMREAREKGKPYDLILLDWKMPNLDGLEIARLIRKNYSKKIPILLFTAYDWGEIEQEAKDIGVSHFMPKPFFMSVFKDAIRRVMGNPEKAAQAKDNIVEGKHILVVDDIEVNRIILVKILSTLGAECDIAENGQDAMEKFVNSQPGEYDIILMDVQMPVMDGYTATRAIRSSGHPSAHTVPIIAMTANAFVDDVRDAIESGMDAHVAKPIQVDKLKETIRQVLENRMEMEADEDERSYHQCG